MITLKEIKKYAKNNDNEKLSYKERVDVEDKVEEMIADYIIEKANDKKEIFKSLKTKRGYAECSVALNLIIKELITKVKADNLYLGDYKVASHLLNKLKNEFRTKDYIFSDFMNDVWGNIRGYSLPYGQTRTITNNEDGKVLTYVLDKVAKWGIAIVKTKRKEIAVELSSSYPKGKSCNNITFTNAIEKIRNFQNNNLKSNVDEKILEEMKIKEEKENERKKLKKVVDSL